MVRTSRVIKEKKKNHDHQVAVEHTHALFGYHFNKLTLGDQAPHSMKLSRSYRGWTRRGHHPEEEGGQGNSQEKGDQRGILPIQVTSLSSLVGNLWSRNPPKGSSTDLESRAPEFIFFISARYWAVSLVMQTKQALNGQKYVYNYNNQLIGAIFKTTGYATNGVWHRVLRSFFTVVKKWTI